MRYKDERESRVENNSAIMAGDWNTEAGGWEEGEMTKTLGRSGT